MDDESVVRIFMLIGILNHGIKESLDLTYQRRKKHMFVAEEFIYGLPKIYDKHSVSTDGYTCILIKPVSF